MAVAGYTSAMPAARITRLTLTNFRSYRAASVAVSAKLVVLTGRNGAGKTNVLEALSLLGPGRGLRRATLDEIASTDGDGSWAVAAEVEGALGLAALGTGVEPPIEGTNPQRLYRVDREPVTSATAFADHLRAVWLTPTMDQLFNGPASERRRFLDRLVRAVDPEHTGRVAALERSLRSRNRLLEQPRPDSHWLDAVEHETAELAVAVAAMRSETVRRLRAALAVRQSRPSAFPSAEVALDGALEQLAGDLPALEVEDRYRTILRNNRARDAQAGRTLEGPHLTDLRVIYAPKQCPAADASTGEQKALLIGLVLAHASLLADMIGHAPLLLLDEVVAHLDPDRRRALFDELAQVAGQAWLTGADPAAFAEIGPDAEVFEVSSGRLEKVASRRPAGS
jgi:DNA replication and repair protein RecF